MRKVKEILHRYYVRKLSKRHIARRSYMASSRNIKPFSESCLSHPLPEELDDTELENKLQQFPDRIDLKINIQDAKNINESPVLWPTDSGGG